MTQYKTIADLPPASAVNPQDLFELSQFGTSRSVALQTVLAAVPPAGVPEAPLDGQQYARQDAAWSPVAPAGGTVTTVSVVTANGLGGTVATPSTTPALTLSCGVTGLLKGSGAAIAAAVAGTDYVTPAGLTIALGSYLPTAGGSMAAAAAIGWTGRSQLSSPADSSFLLRNNAGTDFSALQFGGTTNAFPALFRNGNALSCLLADGSAFATFNANNINIQNGLFYRTFGSISSPGIDGQFTFFNNAGTAATRLDIATDGTIKFRNRTNTADAITTFATQPTTQNDNSGATTAFVKAALPTALPPNGAAGGGLSGTYPNPSIAPSGTNGQVLTTVGGVTAWAAPAGGNKLLQMVSVETGAVATGTTIIPLDDTIPQQTEGDQYMSLSITPQSATSKLVIEVAAQLSASANVNMILALFQDSTANALAAVYGNIPAGSVSNPYPLRHVMTSGTTSATTFKVRAGPATAATTTFNGTLGGRIFGGVMASSIKITEVLP